MMEMEMEMKMEIENIIDNMIEDALFHVICYNHRDYDREHDCWYDEFNLYIDDYIHNENDNIYNEILDSEYDNDSDCIHKKYYIGSYCEYSNEDDNNTNLQVKTIKNTTFYKFTNEDISDYINMMYYFKRPLDIMQIITNDDGTYKHVILKTFWIKIIQRKWKKIMQEKKEYDKKLKKHIYSLSNTFQFMKNSYKGLYGMNL